MKYIPQPPIDDFEFDDEFAPPPANWEDLHKEAIQRERAQLVIDELYDGLPFPDFDATPEENQKIYEFSYRALECTNSQTHLDANSIWHFAMLANEKGFKRQSRDACDGQDTVKTPSRLPKQNVRDCWERWQKNQPKYKSKSAFARDMLDKYESLESQRVIERWCKEWESEPSQQSTYPAG